MDCLAVYANDFWLSYISHMVPYDKSCMISHWPLVDDSAGQLWMEDIYGYALETVPDFEEVCLDLALVELNLPVVPGGEGHQWCV